MKNNDEFKEDMTNLLYNMHFFLLKGKKHIQKYLKYRRLTSEVLSSMMNYVFDGKYDLNSYLKTIEKEFNQEINYIDFSLDGNNRDDLTILEEITIFKVHPKIPSVTEIYLEKHRFRNEEKIKMLESFNNSFVGLFTVIKTDTDNGYVYLKDYFTGKEFKVVDIYGSVLPYEKSDLKVYFYDRIITYEGISFKLGIHCNMSDNNKFFNNFIQKYKKHPISDLSRCILLYQVSKKERLLKVKYNEVR